MKYQYENFDGDMVNVDPNKPDFEWLNNDCPKIETVSDESNLDGWNLSCSGMVLESLPTYMALEFINFVRLSCVEYGEKVNKEYGIDYWDAFYQANSTPFMEKTLIFDHNANFNQLVAMAMQKYYPRPYSWQ